MNEFSEDLNTEREIKWRKALIQKDCVKKEHEEKIKNMCIIKLEN